jgi:uncharacterized membrane protein
MTKKKLLPIIFLSLIIFQLFIFNEINVESSEAECNEQSQMKTKQIKNRLFTIQNTQVNAIETAKITCFLHLKTAQILVDIQFVGIAEEIIFLPEATRNETLIILGEVRNIRVVEEDTIVLEHLEEFDGNFTTIKFELSSTIPEGIKRNVKITLFQDCLDYDSHYNFKLGLNWNRTIGSQNIIFICDHEISLLDVNPEPHTISTITGQLVLSWLQVNPTDFQTSLNYTRKLALKNLLITPNEWNIGKIRSRNNPITKVFSIFNNESTQLSGVIIAPFWAVVNVSEWQLNVGETLYIEVSIDLSETRTLNSNVTLQCSFTYLPVNIGINGEVIEINLLAIFLPVFSVALISMGLALVIKLIPRRRSEENNVLSMDDSVLTEEISSEEITEVNINLQKWRELLTEKEFQIFEVLVENKELTQTDICRLTNLSKSTVSRAISRLEVKGLIKKKKYGISNFVIINNEFF